MTFPPASHSSKLADLLFLVLQWCIIFFIVQQVESPDDCSAAFFSAAAIDFTLDGTLLSLPPSTFFVSAASFFAPATTFFASFFAPAAFFLAFFFVATFLTSFFPFFKRAFAFFGFDFIILAAFFCSFLTFPPLLQMQRLHLSMAYS